MLGWLVGWALAASPVDIDVVGQAPGGAAIVSPSTGLGLTVPTNGRATLMDTTLVVTADGSVATVQAVPGLSLDAAAANVGGGLVIGTVGFQVVGEAQRTSERLIVQLMGVDLMGGRHAGWAMAHRFGDLTAVVMATGTESDREKTKTLFDGLVATLSRKASSAVPHAAVAASKGPWVDEVRGRQLRFYSPDSTTRLIAELCSDGSMWAHSGSSAMSAPSAGMVGVSAASASDATGTWSVTGDRLTVTWADGSSEVRTLSWGPDGEFQMDGARWLRTDPERCH